MHAEVLAFVEAVVTDHGPFLSVVDIGGRDVNGTSRALFGPADVTVIDLRSGPGVHVVADAATWNPPRPVDAVVCTEVLEHAPNAADLCAAAHRWLRPGGVFIVTCATDPRAPHSGLDEDPIRPDEHYRNVALDELGGWLDGFASRHIEAHPDRGDLYAWAIR